MKGFYNNIIIITISWFLASCNKQNEWLDVKSDKSDVLLSTAKDYQALLDNFSAFNSLYPAMGAVCTDNITADKALWQQSQPDELKAYVFSERIFDDPMVSPNAWFQPYKRIATCNIIVEGLETIKNVTLASEYDNILGSALFFRAFNYFYYTQTFCVPYNKNTVSTSLGIPIRKTTDVNEKSVRPTLQVNYDHILNDLITAEGLLPELSPYQSRPSKAAARGMLARVYLTMGNYTEALKWASSALEIKSDLIDFNSLNTTAQFSFSLFPDNKEVIWYLENSVYRVNYHPNYGRVNPELYDLYNLDDRRKSVFFSHSATGGHILFKGQYTGQAYPFGGIATNELYLIKAEALARLERTDLALDALNELLIKRYETGKFLPVTANTPNEALKIIINERRKELPFLSDMRWQDLRRLNQEPQFAKKVIHTIDGVDYVLEPNSSKYVFDIPLFEINLSDIEQNNR